MRDYHIHIQRMHTLIVLQLLNFDCLMDIWVDFQFVY